MHKMPCTEIQHLSVVWLGTADLVVAWALLRCMTLTQLHAASLEDRLLTKLPTNLQYKMAKQRDAYVTDWNVKCMIKAGVCAAGHIEGICCSGASVVDGTAQQGEAHLPVQLLPRH